MAYTQHKSIVSPPGVAVWPHLSTPDAFLGNITYNTKLILDPADTDVQAYVAAVDAACKAAYDAGIADIKTQLSEATGKKKADLKAAIDNMVMHKPYTPSYSEDGEPDGKLVFNFKRTAEGIYKTGRKAGEYWKAKIQLIDAAKVPIPSGVNIWGGTTMRVKAEMVAFSMTGTGKAGISMRLAAVQIIDLVSGGGESDTSGFDMEEGYSANNATSDLSSKEEAPEDEDF